MPSTLASSIPPAPSRRSRLRWSLCCLLLAACGEKVGTPLPEPPALSPIDPAKLSLPDSEVSILVDHIAVLGAPGTLDGADRVLVTNLTSGARASAGGERDGTFRVDVAAMSGDALRVEVDTAEGRTPPTDLEYTGEAIVELPLPGCIRALPERFVDVSESVLVGVRNACDEPLAVLGVALVVDDGGFAFDPDPGETELEPGEELLVEVTALDPSADGDVLRFDVERDERLHLLAISLRRPQQR